MFQFENPPTESGVQRIEWEIETAGGKTKIYEFIPQNPVSEVPVFLAPGFGGIESIYEESILTFVRTNRRRVITIDHPKSGGRRLEEYEKDSASPELSRKSRNISEVLTTLARKGIKRVDAVTHSEGTINLLEAVARNLKQIRYVIFFAPAGLVDGKDKKTFTDSLTHLVHNFLRGFFSAKVPESESEEQRRRKKFAKQEGTIYILKNILRSLEEIVGIAATDLGKNLKSIREESDEKNLGIKMIVAAPIEDTLFPFEEMKRTLQQLIEAKILDGVIVVPFGHDAPYSNEKELALVGTLFGTLEGKEDVN